MATFYITLRHKAKYIIDFFFSLQIKVGVSLVQEEKEGRDGKKEKRRGGEDP